MFLLYFFHFQSGRNLVEYQTQAKQLFKKLSQDPNPPPRCTLETTHYLFQ